jgi:hypothetical protein
MEERFWVYVQQQSRALSQWLVREYLEPLEANKEFLLTGCCCLSFSWFRFSLFFLTGFDYWKMGCVRTLSLD